MDHHPKCSDDNCGRGNHLSFPCKMEHWRTSGIGVSLPQHFRNANREGYTQRELARETIEGCAAMGKEVRRVGSSWV